MWRQQGAQSNIAGLLGPARAEVQLAMGSEGILNFSCAPVYFSCDFPDTKETQGA
jgi:hypothetical protein